MLCCAGPAAGTGFNELAGYIFGNNRSGHRGLQAAQTVQSASAACLSLHPLQVQQWYSKPEIYRQ